MQGKSIAFRPPAGALETFTLKFATVKHRPSVTYDWNGDVITKDNTGELTYFFVFDPSFFSMRARPEIERKFELECKYNP